VNSRRSETSWITQGSFCVALGVGKKVLPPEQGHPVASRVGSLDRPRSPAASQPHAEKVQAAPATSTTLLERVTGADGLVQLVPKKVDDIPEPVPALRESMEALKSRSLDRPPLTGDEPKTTTPTYEAPETGSVDKKADIPTSTSPKRGAPPRPKTMTERPGHIDLPKPPRFPMIRSPGDRLSPTLIRPPTPENVGSADVTPGLPILVVDDDRMTRMLMQRMLERLKCVVTTAANGQQALELIVGMSESRSVDTPGSNEGEYFADGRVPDLSAGRGTGDPATPGASESKFALVFLDNQMPVMSGVEMVRKLRKLGRKDLVVGVTGNALLVDQEEYLAAGVD
jgi:osomolarity two-component system sensor histidine kinase SLN1